MSETVSAPRNIESGSITVPDRPGMPIPAGYEIHGIAKGELVERETVQIGRPAPSTVRRMEVPDLMQLQDWLAYRLHERYPEATAPQIKGFLRGCIGNNEWWFVRTEVACGLAQLIRLPLEPQPIVQDFFVFAQPDEDGEAADQAASIYPAMASWAAHQNASRLLIPRYSDVTGDTIRSRMQQTPRSAGWKYLELGRVY